MLYGCRCGKETIVPNKPKKAIYCSNCKTLITPAYKESDSKFICYAACFYPCEEGGYTVTIPDLPGCVTEGDSLNEALTNTIEVATGWLIKSQHIPYPSNNIIPDEYENGFIYIITFDLEKIKKGEAE